MNAYFFQSICHSNQFNYLRSVAKIIPKIGLYSLPLSSLHSMHYVESKDVVGYPNLLYIQGLDMRYSAI
jgi:hypothetical protein